MDSSNNAPNFVISELDKKYRQLLVKYEEESRILDQKKYDSMSSLKEVTRRYNRVNLQSQNLKFNYKFERKRRKLLQNDISRTHAEVNHLQHLLSTLTKTGKIDALLRPKDEELYTSSLQNKIQDQIFRIEQDEKLIQKKQSEFVQSYELHSKSITSNMMQTLREVETWAALWVPTNIFLEEQKVLLKALGARCQAAGWRGEAEALEAIRSTLNGSYHSVKTLGTGLSRRLHSIQNLSTLQGKPALTVESGAFQSKLQLERESLLVETSQLEAERCSLEALRQHQVDALTQLTHALDYGLQNSETEATHFLGRFRAFLSKIRPEDSFYDIQKPKGTVTDSVFEGDGGDADRPRTANPMSNIDDKVPDLSKRSPKSSPFSQPLSLWKEGLYTGVIEGKGKELWPESWRSAYKTLQEEVNLHTLRSSLPAILSGKVRSREGEGIGVAGTQSAVRSIVDGLHMRKEYRKLQISLMRLFLAEYEVLRNEHLSSNVPNKDDDNDDGDSAVERNDAAARDHPSNIPVDTNRQSGEDQKKSEIAMLKANSHMEEVAKDVEASVDSFRAIIHKLSTAPPLKRLAASDTLSVKSSFSSQFTRNIPLTISNLQKMSKGVASESKAAIMQLLSVHESDESEQKPLASKWSSFRTPTSAEKTNIGLANVALLDKIRGSGRNSNTNTSDMTPIGATKSSLLSPGGDMEVTGVTTATGLAQEPYDLSERVSKALAGQFSDTLMLLLRTCRMGMGRGGRGRPCMVQMSIPRIGNDEGEEELRVTVKARGGVPKIFIKGMDAEDVVNEFVIQLTTGHLRSAIGTSMNPTIQRLLNGERPLVRLPLLNLLLNRIKLESISKKAVRKILRAYRRQPIGQKDFAKCIAGIDISAKGSAVDGMDILTVRSPTGDVIMLTPSIEDEAEFAEENDFEDDDDDTESDEEASDEDDDSGDEDYGARQSAYTSSIGGGSQVQRVDLDDDDDDDDDEEEEDDD